MWGKEIILHRVWRGRTKSLEPLQGDELEIITPIIYCHALYGISSPQALKIEGYLKNKKVTMLIDYGSTHNFIHYKVAKDLNCFVYPTPEFQLLIVDVGTIKCSRKCHNINISMGEYVLNSSIIPIPMGYVDVVLGVQWLQ